MILARNRVLPGALVVVLVSGHHLRRSGSWLGVTAVT